MLVAAVGGCGGETEPRPRLTVTPTTTVGGDIDAVIDTRDPEVLARDLTVDRSCTVEVEPTVLAGADVALHDGAGTIIGRGSLGDGEIVPGEEIPANAVCRMSFRFSVPDELLTSDFYELEVGGLHEDPRATTSSSQPSRCRLASSSGTDPRRPHQFEDYPAP